MKRGTARRASAIALAAVVSVLIAACGAAPTPVAPTPLPVPTLAPAPTLAPTPTLAPVPTATPKTVVLEPKNDFDEYFKGSANAPVTFDMYGDFQCPACGEFARTIEPDFIKAYVDTGKVKYVWHDFTWIGDESISAAQAARCAGRQGQFWAYHDYLYNHQRGENEGQFSDANLQSFAQAVGLDGEAFQTCMELQPDLPNIKRELRNGLGLRVQVTPSFLINGDLKVGAPPMSRLAPLLDTYVARGPVR